ncbi:acetate kinase [Stenoxybacter acetivorans]|nr:acetate kinase [Stenoxybacter acetivorans]
MVKQSLVLILNCGSSSLKGAVLNTKNGDLLLSCLAEKLGNEDAVITIKKDIAARRSWHGTEEDTIDYQTAHEVHQTHLQQTRDHEEAVAVLMAELKAYGLYDYVKAVGHRVVHGGEKFAESAVITPAIMKELDACVGLAPLHNPANILGIQAAQHAFPELKHVAVFDTAFHQTMPSHAYRYAIPAEYYEKHGVRRYGFHGTSYRYVAQEAGRVLNRDSNRLALVIAHLGNGASISAVLNGKSQDTSMGLTPLEGLVMGTRSGDIDPSLFSFLSENFAMSVEQTTNMLNRQSGLLGLSGLSNDCRTLEAAAKEGHAGATLALEVFAYRLAKYIGAMTVACGRLDALVFTGGIGENSVGMRHRVLKHLAVLGLYEDAAANQATVGGKAGIISLADKPVVAAVIPTNEELMIAQDAARLSGLV